MTSIKHVLAAGAAICALTAAGHALAQQRTFDVPAEAAADSIPEFARQAGIQIIAPDDVLNGVRTTAVYGQQDARAALHTLLVGTGLMVVSDNGKTIVLRREQRGAGAGPIGTATNADPAVVSEVIVTAQKKAEDKQNVPLSVSAVKADTLVNNGEFRLMDYAARIPGLEVDSDYGVPGNASVTIRGVSTGSQQAATVAIYVDDVEVSPSGQNGQGGEFAPDLFPYDLDHVEVLKGPQGTLYGASALGGVIKYVTRPVDLQIFSGEMGVEVVDVEHGPQTGWGVHGGVNIPLETDELGLTLSAAHEFFPGYITNVADGQKGINHGDQDGARAALLWKPTNDLTIKLSALFDQSDFKALGVIDVGANGVPVFGYLDAHDVRPQEEMQNTQVYSGVIDYSAPLAKFTSVTAYSHEYNVTNLDASALLFPIFGVYASSNGFSSINRFSQELRLASNSGGPIDWLLGAYYAREVGNDDGGVYAYSPTTQALLFPLIASNQPENYEEYSAFGNGTYHLTEKWDVSAGIRVSREHQTFDPHYVGLLAPANLPTAPETDNPVTYSASTQYHFTPDKMVYARVATGFTAGGPNIIDTGTLLHYGPETTTNYEIGLKSEWLERRLMVDVAAYYIDWQKIQLPFTAAPPDFTSYIANAGSAVSKGVELESSYVIIPGFTLGVNAAYNDAYLTSTIVGIGASGDQLPLTSHWTTSETLDYTRALWSDWKGRLGLAYRYVGSRNSTLPEAYDFHHLPGYGYVSVSAGVSNDHWSANLYVKNLTDERTYTTWIGPSGPAILEPRSVGLSIDRSF